MSEKLKVGVVGCGTIADIHAQALQASSHALLHSFFSRNEENVRRCQEKYGAPGYTDWDQFIGDPDLDAVSVCTPSGTHLDYGEKATAAGKHVIVEKPVEVTLERARTLIDTCRDRDVKLAVIYQTRFVREIQGLKEKLAGGIIGDIFWGEAMIKWYRGQDYYDQGVWRGTFRLDGGGALINQGIHTIDLLQWILGEVETVFGQTGIFAHRNIEGEDTGVAVLRFRSGAVGIIGGATSIRPPQPRKIELHGTKGTAKITDNNVEIVDANGTPLQKTKETAAPTGAASPLAGFSIEPHRDQFDAIVKAIRDNAEPPVTGAESLRSLAIVRAIYESDRTGRPVQMKDFIK